MSNDAATAIRTVQGIYESLQRFDLTALDAVVEPNFAVHAPPTLPYGGTTYGIDQFAARMTTFSTFWDAPTFDAHTFTANDDGIVSAHILLTATSRSTGRKMTMNVVEVWHLSDEGKVIEQRTFYFDPQVAADAAGQPVS